MSELTISITAITAPLFQAASDAAREQSMASWAESRLMAAAYEDIRLAKIDREETIDDMTAWAGTKPLEAKQEEVK